MSQGERTKVLMLNCSKSALKASISEYRACFSTFSSTIATVVIWEWSVDLVELLKYSLAILNSALISSMNRVSTWIRSKHLSSFVVDPAKVNTVANPPAFVLISISLGPCGVRWKSNPNINAPNGIFVANNGSFWSSSNIGSGSHHILLDMKSSMILYFIRLIGNVCSQNYNCEKHTAIP